jgi:hypothetical protein
MARSAKGRNGNVLVSLKFLTNHSRESDHILDHTNLVFAQQWQMHQDFNWLGISCKQKQLGFTSV